MIEDLGFIGKEVKENVDKYKELFEFIGYDTDYYIDRGVGIKLRAKKKFANIEEAAKRVNGEVKLKDDIIYFKGFLGDFNTFVSYLRVIK